MPGFISSLLVEPILRQARRLSPQSASSSPQNTQAGAPNTQRSSVRSKNNDTKGVGVVSGEGYPGLGQSSRYTEPANGSAGSSRLPLDLNGQRQDSERALQSGIVMDENGGDGALPPDQPQPDSDSTGRSRRNGGASGRGLENSFEMNEIRGKLALPEDDGMGQLRRRIHSIRDLDVSNAQKAQLIHTVMTESYYTTRGGQGSQSKPNESSQFDIRKPGNSETLVANRDEEPSSQLSMNLTSTAPCIPPTNPYNLTREDLAPTYAPRVEADLPVCDGEDIETEEYEEACLGCEHYKRNVKLQCYTCKKWYTCRFCHDEVEDHLLNRRMTENMLCMVCGHAQPAAQWCEECEEPAAQYYCSVCKLWNNDSKKNIYHCTDCGICRIGQGLGKDFFHCKTCSVCLPMSIANTHRCIERSTQCDCPICGDYMFTSPETVVVMRCGHSIHHKCLSEHSKSSYRCPICSKTITNMEYAFRNLDRAIESQPMPEEFKDTKALAYCNDCGAKSIVQYHWLGLRCDLCESYNTAQVRLLHGDVLDSLEDQSGARDIPGSQPRPSSFNPDGAPLSPTLASLQINTNSVPASGSHPRLGSPLSAEPNGQFASYSLTRDRAVSPVISNYFGLPPDREAEKSKSASLPGHGAPKSDPGDKDGEFKIWGSKLKYRYGFLGEETQSVDELSEADGEEVYTSGESEQEEEELDDDDDDDDDSIDIFGHR